MASWREIMRSGGKMSRILLISAICMGGAFLISPVASADDPAKAFDELYSAEIVKVSASKNPKDTVDFALKLLENAGKIKDDPGLKEYILNKACEFAMKDFTGFSTAVMAVDTLMTDFAGKKEIYKEKMLGLYKTQYEKSKGADRQPAGEDYVKKLLERGNEILSAIPASAPAGDSSKILPAVINISPEAVTSANKFFNEAKAVAAAIKSNMTADVTQCISTAANRLDLKKKFEDLSSKLAAKPDDPAIAKNITMLCLLELDDPVAAAKYSPSCKEDAIKIYTPMAAKPISELSETSIMELAGWYKALAVAAAAKPAKIIAYNRCRTYLSKFISLHQKSDTEFIKAQNTLNEVGSELTKLDPAGLTAVTVLKANLPQKKGIIWTYDTGKKFFFRLKCSPDGRKLAAVDQDQFVWVYDIETKKEIFKTDRICHGESFTDDSRFLLVSSDPFGVYDADTGNPVIKDIKNDDMNNYPTFSGNGRLHFGFKNNAKSLDITEVKTGKLIKEIPLNLKGYAFSPAVALSPDGKLAFVSGIDNSEEDGKKRFCRIVDLDSGKTIQILSCSQESYIFKNFYPMFLSDGKRVAAKNNFVSIAVWDIRNGKTLFESKKKGFFAISPDGKKIAEYTGKLEIIDPTNSKDPVEIEIDYPNNEQMHIWAQAMCFSPDGQYLFVPYSFGPDSKTVEKGGIFLIGVGQ